MATDFEAAEREDRLASVSESGVSLVSKERLAELKAQLDEDRHLLEQERAIQVRMRAAFDKERADLDEKAETLAIEAERMRERARELDQRESAVRQRENNLSRHSGERTNPHLIDETPGQQDWHLPTVAATIEEARAMMSGAPRRDSKPQPERVPTGKVRAIMIANPVATFSFGFAAAAIVMMLLWGLL